MKLVSDIMRLSGRDLRDSVLSILTEEWPLSAREIYKRVSKDYKINVTYQGVHKAVRHLEETGLLTRKDNLYRLDDGCLELNEFIHYLWLCIMRSSPYISFK